MGSVSCRYSRPLVLSVILISAAYLSAAFIRGAFNSRFLFVDGSFEVMKPYNFMRMFKYALILLPGTLIISTLNNLIILKNVSNFVDNLINVVVYSLGGELVVIIAMILTYSTPEHPVVFNLHAILSLLVLIPITNYLYKKLFKLTGSVWAGAIVVALLLGWRSASYISHQFMYWGPNTLVCFLGHLLKYQKNIQAKLGLNHYSIRQDSRYVGILPK